MVLLDKSPLENINNTLLINSVIKRVEFRNDLINKNDRQSSRRPMSDKPRCTSPGVPLRLNRMGCPAGSGSSVLGQARQISYFYRYLPGPHRIITRTLSITHCNYGKTHPPLERSYLSGPFTSILSWISFNHSILY